MLISFIRTKRVYSRTACQTCAFLDHSPSHWTIVSFIWTNLSNRTTAAKTKPVLGLSPLPKKAEAIDLSPLSA
jgi:hypothetical protein